MLCASTTKVVLLRYYYYYISDFTCSSSSKDMWVKVPNVATAPNGRRYQKKEGAAKHVLQVITAHISLFPSYSLVAHKKEIKKGGKCPPLLQPMDQMAGITF